MRSTVTESLKPLNKYFFPLCAGFVLVVSAVWDRFPAVDVFFLAAGIFLMFLPYEIKFLLRALQPSQRRPFDFKWFSAACLGIAMIGVASIGQMDGVSIAMLTVGLFLGIFPFS
ncbi:MAG: hypothetical protein BLM47_12365 [Candidatus Reconcilbacillus cellulovorans]|uniref:Uncharacterized protein n=1 Tax=Candidatus Reconcilbacillus cellulovorans TaxID=1906605 RepID=A0A2A6DXH7_9BACL|nr:MAG: hypothetical protein BLM47_12365 [Candidatus Reconcilbacillus cellulovorans]